jgi:hypothetical protein
MRMNAYTDHRTFTLIVKTPTRAVRGAIVTGLPRA